MVYRLVLSIPPLASSYYDAKYTENDSHLKWKKKRLKYSHQNKSRFSKELKAYNSYQFKQY